MIDKYLSDLAKLQGKLSHYLTLTDAQKAWLVAVATMPDEQIDYSDASHLPDAVWAKVGELPGGQAAVTLGTGRADVHCLKPNS